MSIGDKVGIPPPSRQWGASDALVANDVFVGVEIELEGLGGLTAPVSKLATKRGLWRITDDGSLRNTGREFIMQEVATGQPLMGKDIIRALDDFGTCIDALKAKDKPPVLSDRTSIHVHLDVRNLEDDQFKRLILLYYAFEDILFKWIGEDRHKSNYCRPASSHYDVIERVGALLNGRRDFNDTIRDGNKYDALNFEAVRHLGSLEVRSMRGTYDKALILRWVNILLRLREACLDERINLAQFPEQVSASGMQDFLQGIFKDQAQELLPFADDIDILRGVRTAQEILVVATAAREGIANAYNTGNDTEVNLNLFKDNILGA